MKEELKVIVDNRERNLEVIDGLSELGIKLSFLQLPVGDYVISDRVCIERKTMSDLENSIINARLFDQIDRLSTSFAKPILIVEGSGSDHLLASNVLFGTAVALFLDYNVQILSSSGAEETVAIIAKIAEREQNGRQAEPRAVGRKRAFTSSQWQILILSALPGTGPKLARSLIGHFKTIRGVASASEDELMEVEKVGKKKAETIFRLLNEEFREQGQ